MFWVPEIADGIHVRVTQNGGSRARAATSDRNAAWKRLWIASC